MKKFKKWGVKDWRTYKKKDLRRYIKYFRKMLEKESISIDEEKIAMCEIHGNPNKDEKLELFIEARELANLVAAELWKNCNKVG